MTTTPAAVDRRPTAVDGALTCAAILFLLVITCVAFALSFDAMRVLAIRSGVINETLAPGIPILIDATIIVAILIRTRKARRGDRHTAYPTLMLVAAAAVSLGFNVAHALYSDKPRPTVVPLTLAIIIAAVPPSALTACFHMALVEFGQDRRPPRPKRVRRSLKQRAKDTWQRLRRQTDSQLQPTPVEQAAVSQLLDDLDANINQQRQPVGGSNGDRQPTRQPTTGRQTGLSRAQATQRQTSDDVQGRIGRALEALAAAGKIDLLVKPEKTTAVERADLILASANLTLSNRRVQARIEEYLRDRHPTDSAQVETAGELDRTAAADEQPAGYASVG